MFKKFLLLSLLMAILMPWQAKAQETLTVYDGTDANQYIPMYGYYFDAYTKSECILPASELTDMEGGTIIGLTFYAKTVATTNSTWETANQKVFIKEVTGTTLGGSFSGMEGATVVFDGLLTMPTTSTDGYTITFTEGYVYNGGNLLIGIYNDAKGNYNKVEWYGTSGLTSGVSAYGNNSSSLGSCSYTAQSFLPKTTFTYEPTAGGCGKPSMETPSNVASNSATVSWTGGSGSFNVEYKKASDEEWTNRATNHSGYSVRLTGLESNTSYQARVQSICEGNVVSSWATTSFETPCSSVESFPFIETFDDLTTNGQIPGCWNNEEGTTTNASYRWCYNSSYSTGHGGKCVRFDSYSNSSGNTNFLKTPVMSLPQSTAMQLRFWYKNPNGGDFSVYISTDGGQTHETALATGMTNIAEWTEKTIDLSDYKGESNVVIVFKGTSNYGSNDARIYLDDVNIEIAPTCPKQNALHVTALTSSSVTLDWTAGNSEQDHWDLFITTDANVTPNASTVPTVTNTDQKPYTRTGLNPETVYFAFVRARCSDTNQSDWTDVCRFVTPQIPVLIDGEHPYENDFENTCGWLFVNGDRPNQWWYGSAVNNTNNGEKAIYVSNDGGTSNTYTNTKSVVYATKAFSFAEGTYTFAYDWRAKGNQYFDYIRVALVPASYEIVATENLPTGLSDTQLPTGWIALDGGSKLNNSDAWSTKVADEIQVPAGEYKMVVVWRNMTYSINQPPAAIDNISISLTTCPKPTLSYVSNSNTAHSGTVEWTGNAEGYEIAYRPASDFNPADETLGDVTRATLGSVNSYTLENLDPETKYYIYLQANCGDEGGNSSWSNRVTFTTLATCLAPSYLTDKEVTSTSVFLSWTKGTEDQDAWQFRYKKTSDSEYTYVLVENNPSSSYELTGLEPATSYDVNVRAWCGGDDYSKWSYANQSYDKTITTACASITLPYTCNFEGAVETAGHFSTYSVPKCWDRIEMQYGSYSPYTYYPYVYDYSSDAHGGTKSLRMYRTPNSANQTIILPAIDDSYQMSDLQIRFWAKAGSSNNTLSVGIMDGESFTEVQSVEGVSTSYAEFTVPLTSYAGNGRNIAIKCGSSDSYLYYYIDDVTVEVIPSCLIPTGLTNTAVTYNSASFVWQPGKDETEWNIQYKKTSASEWSNPIHVTELPTTENPFVLTGLQRGIEYEARIQAYCDAEDQSEWNSMPVSFTTDCGVWPIDTENSLFEDFSSSAFPPACWNWIRVSNYYGWQHSSGQYNPLDQQGTAYSYWPTGETYLILPQMHINGAAKLTFDMVFSGDGSGEESSVVLSTTGYGKLDFTNTLWTATEFPKTKTTISLDLSAYNDRDIYIAFKYKGVGTSGRMWYIDNVQVYVGEIFTKDITAYTEGSNDRYYLIASPVGEVNPENVANMLANNYDLYYFDQSKELEWINYEGTDGNFSLIPGKGYLYANSGNVTLRFVGQPYNRDGQISLDKVSGAEFEGWNLIGNPFGTNATLDLPYFRMNADGTALNATTETTAVAPMEGVFVIATTDDQKATFTATRISPKQVPMLNININRNQGTAIDNAIIRFDEGGILPKFQLNPNSTKIYIPENSQDYAIVRSTGSGELPVNFKATRNGRYYISVNAEDVEVNYLHLIDNLTGNDVDLLASGSYEFEAKITDYASRFKLMFNVNEDNLNNQDNFAFYHNGEIIINGQGTLRVFDALGRQLFTKDLSSLTSHLSPLTSPGVYVIQLIQNDKVRTQKIVIP